MNLQTSLNVSGVELGINTKLKGGGRGQKLIHPDIMCPVLLSIRFLVDDFLYLHTHQKKDADEYTMVA